MVISIDDMVDSWYKDNRELYENANIRRRRIVRVKEGLKYERSRTDLDMMAHFLKCVHVKLYFLPVFLFLRV